ncbi:MAG: metalloregulator ArsR/SmtB family transcription factor [candidate division Zixibacteria bacterium]|nr:metalloregulator ArsR/SmtB family transcription factor [candidate division Zixibacteria bacterium]
MANYRITMRPLLTVTNALADRTRLRLLMGLREGELCACQLIELVGLAPSTVSKHMFLLRQAGLVESRKIGRWVYYRWPGRAAPLRVRHALKWVAESLTDDPQIAKDTKHLARLLKSTPETLCRKQTRKPVSSSSAPATRAAARWRRAGRVTSGRT